MILSLTLSPDCTVFQWQRHQVNALTMHQLCINCIHLQTQLGGVHQERNWEGDTGAHIPLHFILRLKACLKGIIWKGAPALSSM